MQRPKRRKKVLLSLPGVEVVDWVLVVLGMLLTEGVFEWSAFADWSAKASKAQYKTFIVIVGQGRFAEF